MYDRQFLMSGAVGYNLLAYHPKAEQHTGALFSPTKPLTSTRCVAAPFVRKLFLPLMLVALAGCSANTQALNAFENTQANLKVAEIPSTATAGQNYEYCYGCIEFNYRQFGRFDSSTMPGASMMAAIVKQVNTCAAPDNAFTTQVNLVGQAPALAPEVLPSISHAQDFSKTPNTILEVLS